MYVIYVYVCRTYGLPRSFIECELCGQIMTQYEQFRDLWDVTLEVKGPNHMRKRGVKVVVYLIRYLGLMYVLVR